MRTRLLFLSLLLVPACGATKVRLYEGPELPPDQVTWLYNNPHLEVTVDRNYTVPRVDSKKLHRLELPTGHHAVEVKCLYTSDVTYAPAKGAEGSTKPLQTEYTESPPIAVVMEGQAGHSYKPRVRFHRDAEGVPGCHVKMFDVTTEDGGEKNNFY